MYVMWRLEFSDTGVLAVQIQVFQLFIRVTKYLLSTCFVSGIMLGAGDAHSLHVGAKLDK